MEPPSVRSIARLWAHGPNAGKIGRVLRRFNALTPEERQLLVIGLDVEEGILPLIHPGGRASRREVLCDERLLAVGDDVKYGDHVTAVLGAAAAPTASASSRPQAQAAEAAHPSRAVSDQKKLGLDEVIAEDKLGMTIWFPQFRFGYLNEGTRRAWLGIIRPFAFTPIAFEILAAYQGDPESPLMMYVRRPQIHPQAPHRYEKGALCTFFPSSGCWIRGREGDDLVELLRFVVVWLIRYLCWLVFDRWWPGVETPHHPEWLLQNLRDDDFCPYHMPRRWGTCCKWGHVAALHRRRIA